ncbi:Gustatory receptor 154c [Halyomorpha halys]|nr:Gustatory receptor 154c [Halyomorpha halys]
MEQKTLKSAFKMATYVGAFPSYEIETFKLNKISLLIVVSIKLIIGIHIYRSISSVTAIIHEKDLYYKMQFHVHPIVDNIRMSYLFLYECIKRDRFQRLNSQYIELDHMMFFRLKSGKIDEMDYSHHYVLFAMIMLQFFVRVLDPGFLLFLGEFYFICLIISFVHPFVLTLTNLHSRFVALRKSLFMSCNCFSLNNRSNKIKHLEDTLLLFDLLCSTCKTLNSCFSQQLLHFFSVVVFVFVHNLYYAILEISKNKFHKVLFIKTSTMVIFFFVSIIITTLCQKISKEAKEFNALLYQLMIDDKTNDIATNKKLQLHIAMKREVQFTACGFFTLDYTLVHSMIAAATTYLVILIQFGQSTTSATFLPSASPFANTTFPTELSTAQH